MTDMKTEIFKALVQTPARIAPATSEPLVEGTSLHREDVGFILGELQLRHAIELIPNEPPEAAEEPEKRRGKAGADAQEGRASAVPTSAPDPAEEGSPEDSQGSRSKTAKMRRRLAKLTADIARMEAQSAKKSGTK